MTAFTTKERALAQKGSIKMVKGERIVICQRLFNFECGPISIIGFFPFPAEKRGNGKAIKLRKKHLLAKKTTHLDEHTRPK